MKHHMRLSCPMPHKKTNVSMHWFEMPNWPFHPSHHNFIFCYVKFLKQFMKLFGQSSICCITSFKQSKSHMFGFPIINKGNWPSKKKVLEVPLVVHKSKVVVQVTQASNSGVIYFAKHFFVICNMISLGMTSWDGKTQQLYHLNVNHLTQFFFLMLKDIKPLTHVNANRFKMLID